MHANQEKQKDLISEKVENYKTEICFFSTSLAFSSCYCLNFFLPFLTLHVYPLTPTLFYFNSLLPIILILYQFRDFST